MNQDQAISGNGSNFQKIVVPFLSIIFLVLNICKEIGQISTVGRQYFLDLENIADLTVSVLVLICQYFYWTGTKVNGYFIPETRNGSSYEDSMFGIDPESGSFFENFLLPTILLLHFNLIV